MQSYRFRQQPMLDRQHARGQCGGIVVVQHRYRPLRDDRSHVDFRRDVVDGAAVDPHAVGKRPAVRVETGIER